ncbi:MAG TPA: RNA methyltransferase [Acidimicrobiales bacterium]|nr:RNA methyltransferase [Acidimicrobiales bacterium]
MGPTRLVDDPADPRVEGYRALNDARYRSRIERCEGLLVAEGELAVRRLLASAHVARSVFVSTARAGALAGVIDAAGGAGAAVYVARPDVMAAVAGYDVHRGVLALGDRLPGPEPADLIGSPGIVLGIEGVNDGENMGALLRHAAAFGASGVLLDPTCCDPFSRRAIRVSVGHALNVRVAQAMTWPAPVEAAVAAGVEVVALTPGGPAGGPVGGVAAGAAAVPIAVLAASVALRRPRRLVVLVGAEGSGLSAAALRAATVTARIPMAAGVDSINVSAAAAIALHRLAEALGGADGIHPWQPGTAPS